MNNILNIISLANWGIFNYKKPIIISGPCSAENETQVIETAIQLKKLGIQIFRAGVWKPRTHPATFEGMGSIALQWLKEVKKETGMLVATEVANAHHVEQCLKAGIDILWIGSRTSPNPFAIQEIADALKNVDMPILVKNPVNPDLELWIGAIERINNAGINKIGLIHRGFSEYHSPKYRNAPKWQIPIEFKRRYPEIPIWCDPSHLGGNKNYIPEISQKAMDLNYEGLMIESHYKPQLALSDKIQQISPIELNNLLNKLKYRQNNFKINPESKLLDLRNKIDLLDEQLLEILAERLNICQEIGQYKFDNNITILQPGRWNNILERNKLNASEYNLNENFIDNIFKLIHQASIDTQTEIMNKLSS